MNRQLLKGILALSIILALSHQAFTQEKIEINNIDDLTLEQMKDFTQDDLVQFSFEELIALVQKFKLSSLDELYELINPSQSTASKIKEDVFNSPLATTVITALEMEQSGARNIPEALRLAPGIIVREQTNGNYDVQIRGNDYIPPGSDISNTVNSTTLIMIDNRPAYNNFLGATFWENLPIDINDLEKIEIIYGPSSALYGPNAVSGVIHLITKATTTEGIKGDVDIQAGTQNTQIAYGAVSYKKGAFSSKLSTNIQQMNRFQDSYYIPQTDRYVTGEEVGAINAMSDTTYNASESNSDYWNASKKGAVNLFLNYHPSEKISIGYTGSYQNSSIQTAYMDIGSVLSTRKSETFSNNINLNLGEFDANLSSSSGHINAMEGLPGYEYDFAELNGKLGYNFKYKNLIIRPGFDANYNYYSDEDYVDIESNSGLLNGSSSMGTLQGSIRMDYTAFNKLRLVGAVNHGYFYNLNQNYTSYQFASSYKFNDKTLVRAVASKANSGLFVLNTYMDKTLQISSPDGNGLISINKVGNTNLIPLEMQMYELGARQRIGKKLQADLSIFYNISENYSQLVNEQNEVPEEQGEMPVNGEMPEPSEMPEGTGQEISMIHTETMQNMDIKSKQLGATLSLKYVMNEKFNSSIFATYQNTTLDNFEVSNLNYYQELTSTSITPDALSENSEYLTLDHTYTPKVFGGASFNYQPAKKWNINASFYAYSKQKSFYTFGQDFVWVEIDPKVTCNLKASYQLTPWLNLYINGRNITNSTSQEFMFTDETGMSILGGVKLNF